MVSAAASRSLTLVMEDVRLTNSTTPLARMLSIRFVAWRHRPSPMVCNTRNHESPKQALPMATRTKVQGKEDSKLPQLNHIPQRGIAY